ncbi:MAG: Hsp70 family protein [Flavobacteriales bacterium]
MKQEAEANAEADKTAKERIETLNQADSLVFQTEKQLKEFGDKISEANRGPIDSALEDLKKAHAEQDVEGCKAGIEKLNNAFQAASQEMYAQQGDAGAQAAGSESTDSNPNDAEVTDVDFEEVK